MKAILLTCAVLSGVVSLATAAPPAKEDAKTKKASKADKENARDMIAKYDTDSDKKLDKTELSNALKKLKRNVVSTKNDTWKKFDEDGDTKIDQKELDKLLEANAEPPEAPVDPKAKPPAKTGGLTLRPQP
jgi:Ca2+-binding EF-hand superfamily protein